MFTLLGYEFSLQIECDSMLRVYGVDEIISTTDRTGNFFELEP